MAFETNMSRLAETVPETMIVDEHEVRPPISTPFKISADAAAQSPPTLRFDAAHTSLNDSIGPEKNADEHTLATPPIDVSDAVCISDPVRSNP
jgi:hypothetical protein